MSERFPQPEAVIDQLRAAGWSEGRHINLAAVLPGNSVPFPKAAEVLSEFFGLKVGRMGPGIACARCEIEFRPSAAMHLLYKLRPYEAQTGAKFYPLGVIDGGHAHLFIDEAGRVYMYYGVLKLMAHTFSAALEVLLLGKPRAPERPTEEKHER